MQLPIPGFLVRPGLTRGFLGLLMGAFGAAFLYRAFAQGEFYTWAALMILIQGALFAGFRGIFLAALFHIPMYVLLNFPIAPPTAPFGEIFLTLNVYLGAVPTIFLIHAFILRKFPGALISAVVIVPGFVTALAAPTLLSSFGAILPWPLYEIIPSLYAAGPGINIGSSLVFGGFGGFFGFMWGMGAMSRGAFAHEGPTYYAEMAAAQQERFTVRRAVEMARRYIPELISNFGPLVRPLAISFGVTLVITIGIVVFSTNGVINLGRIQTNNAEASTFVITGEKFLLFVVIVGVVIGIVAAFAVGLALLMRYTNREVAIVKNSPNQPVKVTPWPLRLLDFILTWVADLLAGLVRSFQK